MGIGLNVEMFESINEMFNKFSIRDEKVSVTSSDGFKLPGKFERFESITEILINFQFEAK